MPDSKNLIQLWKNGDGRKAFLEGYKDWGEWTRTQELDLVFYRYALPNGDTVIAMEHNCYTYRNARGGEWERDVRYYIQKKDTPFTPLTASLYTVTDLLKDEKIRLQKEQKNKG